MHCASIEVRWCLYRTIIDYDRVLVLEKGRVAQFGTPKTLIDQQGIFRQMCLDSGEFNELNKLAHQSA